MPCVLITGTSTGIGKATALQLANEGWLVFCGVRSAVDAKVLLSLHPQLRPVLMDVTADSDVEAAVKLVRREVGPSGLDALICNAGALQTPDPLEIASWSNIQQVVDVNLLGVLRVTRAFLPLLRLAPRARIVFASSMFAWIAPPLLHTYSATKFALRGVADALRIELAPTSVRVVVMDICAVTTPMMDLSRNVCNMRMNKLSEVPPVYVRIITQAIALCFMLVDAGSVGPEHTARDISAALAARRPWPSYLSGHWLLRLAVTLRKLSPDWLWDHATHVVLRVADLVQRRKVKMD